MNPGKFHAFCAARNRAATADTEAEHLATAERAVIDAAVERRKKANLLIGANRMSAEYERAYDEWDAALTAEDAAVDALLAARGKP